MTSWRTQLTATPWKTLEHAYGKASDVPKHIRRLTQADAAEAAAQELWAAVLHQGSLYSATAPAMTTIAQLLVAGDAAQPALTAWLLRNFAAAMQASRDVDDAAIAQAIADGEAAAAANLQACRTALAEIAEMLRTLLTPATTPTKTATSKRSKRAWPAEDTDAVAEVAALLQAFGPDREAAIASLHTPLAQAPASRAAQACMATLVQMGVEQSATDVQTMPGLQLAAALARVATGGNSDADMRLLSDHWPQVVDIAPHTSIALDDSSDASDVGQWLVSLNPAVATQIFTKQPQVDAAAIEALVDVVRSARSQSAQAVQRLLGFAALPATDAGPEPALLIGALRQLPATPQVCDALFQLSARVSHGARVQQGSSEVETDARADAALALLRAGDARWFQPLVQMLLHNPAVRAVSVADSARSRMSLGYAMQYDKAPGNEELAASLAHALRQPPPADRSRDSAGALLDWVASWPAALIRPLLPEVLALLPMFPGAAAGVLARVATSNDATDDQSIHRDEILASLRALTPERDKVQVMLAMASIAATRGEFADLHTVLQLKDKEYQEGALLDLGQQYADDAPFLAWCQSLIGTAMATSHPDRGYQLRAMALLAQQSPDKVQRHWPVLRAIVNDGHGPLAQALALAREWQVQGWLSSVQIQDLQAVLNDMVVTGRKGWGGPAPQASAAAAIALHEWPSGAIPLPGTPARLTRIVTSCLGEDRWSHALGLRMATICLDDTAPAALQRTLRKALQTQLERDQRPATTGDTAIVDEALLRGLRQLLQA